MNANNLLNSYTQESSKEKIGILIEYLNHISGKELSKSIIRQYLLMLKWKQKDIRLLSRCHCKAAAIYLEYLLIESEKISIERFRTIVADVAQYIAYLDKETTSYLSLYSTNTIPSFIHYKHAKSLFQNGDLPVDSKVNYETDLLVLYAIRLTLEKRIRGFLGIDYASINSKPIGLSKLIQVSKSLVTVKYSKSINWLEIEWVNSWLNHHMHRHIRPAPWVIYQLFVVLDSILESTTYIQDGREIHSFFASTVVSDEEQFSNEVLEKLKALNKDIHVKWAWRKEVLVFEQ